MPPYKTKISKYKLWNPLSNDMFNNGTSIRHIFLTLNKIIAELKISDTVLEKFWDTMVIREGTGQIDLDGNEIFDGDILECGIETGLGLVRHVGVMMYVKNEGRWGIIAETNIESLAGEFVEKTKPKIIGNIYQNQELLKKK